MAKKINVQKLKKAWREMFYPSIPNYLPDITLSEHVRITDPCYERGTRCQGQIKDLVPGIYTPVVQYNKEGRVKSLLVYKDGNYSSPLKEPIKNMDLLPYDIGVDSGQCGIFCDSIYPHGESTGEYGEPGFYNDCCNATLGKGYDDSQKAYSCIAEIEGAMMLIEKGTMVEIDNKMKQLATLFNIGTPYYQAGTIQNKGVVSSSGRGDGSYNVYLHKNKDMILIRYI